METVTGKLSATCMSGIKDINETTNESKHADAKQSAHIFGVLRSKEQVVAYGSGEKAEKLITATLLVVELFKPHLFADRLLEVSIAAHRSIFDAISSDGKSYYQNLETACFSLLEYLSLLRSATAAGLISSMNASILEKEVIILEKILESETSKKMLQFSFPLVENDPLLPRETLTSEAFDRAKFFQATGKDEFLKFSVQSLGKESKVPSATSQRHENELSTTRKDVSTTPSISQRHTRSLKDVQLDTMNRKGDLLTLLKFNGPSTMHDIIKVVHGVSVKTLQRTLQELIVEGKVTRSGIKRWSTYALKEK